MAGTGALPTQTAASQKLFDLDVGLNCGRKWLPTERLGWSDTALLVLELAGCREGELRPSVCTTMENRTWPLPGSLVSSPLQP